jgi:hypothetical protein
MSLLKPFPDTLNLIYLLKNLEGGKKLVSRRMASCYPHLFKAIEFDELNLPADNRCWMLQNPSFYHFSFVDRYKDYSVVRVGKHQLVPGKKMSNGWSYYKHYKQYYYSWMPYIQDCGYVCGEFGLGYYASIKRPDSNREFVKFAKDLKVPIVTMGNKDCVQRLTGLNWYHTTDSEEFFSKISHYWYWKSKMFEDPLPHTMLEAIQAGCRIIVPNNDRSFEDGVDDLLSFIEYDKEFVKTNKGCCPELLKAKAWNNWLTNHVTERFAIPVETRKYKSMYDWAEASL